MLPTKGFGNQDTLVAQTLPPGIQRNSFSTERNKLCIKGWLRAGKGEMSLKHTALPENKEVFEQLLGDA